MTTSPETRRVRIGLAQINTTVGDITGNRQKILDTIEQARSSGVDILAFPELAICGYPPEDLLFKPQFIAENLRSLKEITAATAGMTVIIGFVDADQDIYNAAAVIHDGKHLGTYHKIFLPNYGVFDENRYFRSGEACPVYVINGINMGVTICEDIWYEGGPASSQAYSGAELIVNISASPFHAGKVSIRERMVSTRASDNVAVFAFANLVGGQDELVFDGNSLIMDEKGRCLARGERFKEDLVLADIDIENVFRTRLSDPRWRQGFTRRQEQGWLPSGKTLLTEKPFPTDKPTLPDRKTAPPDEIAEVYEALVLGTHDYINKNGFGKVVIGLSGGLDSSLVAAVAADALGSENVVGVAMPSKYSSEGSLTDAEQLAKNLGIRVITVPIEPVVQSFQKALEEHFEGTQPGIAEENIQARTRGTIVMGLSNKFGWLVLTTGNKSEMATGYATLYGDMAGGFAVIKDVPKTLAYKLCRYRNELAGTDIIPQTVIDKPPSAELRPDQKDTDSLPPYEVLDPILTAYVEEDRSIEQIVAAGNDEATVQRIARLVDLSEYKRRQAPPGVKITPRAFGRDRRLPITNRFRG
jgi:NAD+ synthase (glutamine-hydrolysing)